MQAVKLWERGWRALGEAAADQQGHQAAGEPTGRFRELLSAAIASGRAHVADPGGERPETTPEAWGWRVATVGSGDYEREEWRPQGERVGWVDGENLYLEPEASYAAVQKQGRESGEALSITGRTLRKRLHERGLLASTGKEYEGRETLAVRRKLEGVRRDVLHVPSDFLSTHARKPDQPDHSGEDPDAYPDSAPNLWSGSEPRPDHEPDQHNHESDQESGTGRNGQVSDNHWSGNGQVSDHEPDQRESDTYARNSTNGQVGQVSDDSRDHKGGEGETCIHDMSPDVCRLCSGHVRRLVEEGVV
jgi:hypothetical protein